MSISQRTGCLTTNNDKKLNVNKIPINFALIRSGVWEQLTQYATAVNILASNISHHPVKVTSGVTLE